MKRIIAFFRTLRGKLILTYTTVTVLALLALEITILLIIFAFSRGMNSDTNSYLSDVIAVLPSQVRSYLQPGSANQPGLQEWLQAMYENGYASLPPQGVMDSPAAAIIRSDPMVVIAPDGIVLAAAPVAELGLVGRRYTPPAAVARSQEILANAFAMKSSTEDLTAVKPDGNYLVAVPVTQSQGESPLAAVVIVTVKSPPPALNMLWPVFLGIILVTGLILLMGVAPFGAVFGFVMSRGLTRRLKALTQAVDAWSEGNFSVQPQDGSKDEISYLGLRMRHMAERVQVLLQTQHELAMLEERNHLARELHDTVKQEAFATLMQVRAAKNLLEKDPDAARQHLDHAESLIKTTQQELGAIIAELRPAALAGQGLADALRCFLETWSKQTCIPADFQVQNERRLPLQAEQTLYRVAQEALANVARHSRASAVIVRLVYAENQVCLSVADNGVGFDFSGPEKHGVGLHSMRERLAALGGLLSIHSVNGDGTTVTATLPCSKEG